nr:MAG TPA_asm: hypothetical protein [Caudoviricetes sp.]
MMLLMTVKRPEYISFDKPYRCWTYGAYYKAPYLIK